MTPDAAKPAPVRLRAGDRGDGALSTGRLTLVLGGEAVDFELTVPAGPASIEDLLPIFQGLSDLMGDRAIARAEAAGATLSCRAGCGACCRQLVPISASEAQAVTRVVGAMPEPRQSRVRARFAATVEALDQAGLLERLTGEGDLEGLGMDYFRLGLACPFLEDESCSIHPDRPTSCREYLVTSPATACAAPSAKTIDLLPLDGDPSRALLKAEAEIGWSPLVLALTLEDEARPSARERTGPELLGDLLRGL